MIFEAQTQLAEVKCLRWIKVNGYKLTTLWLLGFNVIAAKHLFTLYYTQLNINQQAAKLG